MENDGKGRVNSVSLERISETLEQEAKRTLALVSDSIDSPKVFYALRNAVLTLLQIPDQPFNWGNVYTLFTQDAYRASIIKRLKELTPAFWSEQWDSLWTVEVDPLFAMRQQYIVRRQSLIVYWSEEWEQIPEEVKTHAVDIVKGLR